jgi:rubrerythrin
LITVRCFGWSVLIRTLLASRRRTFLSLLLESGALTPPRFEVPELIGDCVGLERRAQRIYERLAVQFTDRAPVRRFLILLAEQESTHAELLELCEAIAKREGWMERHFARWRAAIPRLKRQMESAEDGIESRGSLDEALCLVLRIESSEINDIFASVVAATDSEFVRRLEAFQEAEAAHMAFIREKIAEFSPGLAEECARLGTKRLDLGADAP